MARGVRLDLRCPGCRRSVVVDGGSVWPHASGFGSSDPCPGIAVLRVALIVARVIPPVVV